MNRPAQIAKDRAEERRKHEHRDRMVYAILIGVVIFFAGYFYPREMALPEYYDPVFVKTTTRWQLGYLDESGDFRQVWTGERIGQVTQWKKP